MKKRRYDLWLIICYNRKNKIVNHIYAPYLAEYLFFFKDRIKKREVKYIHVIKLVAQTGFFPLKFNSDFLSYDAKTKIVS